MLVKTLPSLFYDAMTDRMCSHDFVWKGRSFIERLGLFIHTIAEFGCLGFSGYRTPEIFCVEPIRIYSGVEICQIYYHTIEGEYDRCISGKYQNNIGIQPSLLYRDFKNKGLCQIGRDLLRRKTPAYRQVFFR